MLRSSMFALLCCCTALPVLAGEAVQANVSYFYGGACVGVGYAGAGSHALSVEGQNIILNTTTQDGTSQNAQAKVKPLVNLLFGYLGAIGQSPYFWSLEGDALFLPTSDTLVQEQSIGGNRSRRTSKITQRFSCGLAVRGGLQLQGWSPYVTVGTAFGMRSFEWKGEDLSGGGEPIEHSASVFEPMLKAGLGTEIPVNLVKVRLEYTCCITMKQSEKSFEDTHGDKITQSFKASPSHRFTVGAIFPL
jgi:hypothetical protein